MTAQHRHTFATLVRPRDEEIDLARAALAIAEIVEPVGDHDRVVAALDEDADWLRTRLSPLLDVEQAFRRMCHFLAHDRGFHGNQRDYYHPYNSCLNHVMTTKAGLPITLAIVYIEVGRRLQLDIVGVGLPGHFIVKAVDDEQAWLADPFNQGVLLRPSDCAELVSRAIGRKVALAEHDLAGVTRRQLLVRVLMNLRQLYLRPASTDYRRALETIEYSLVLRPSSLDDVRERGIVYHQLGEVDRAAHDFETYLTYAHDAADAPRIERHLRSLRRQLPPG